jgi:hypothetical protein
MARLTAAQRRQAAAQRKEARFEALVKKKFGYNASANPNNVNAGVTYYTPPQPEGAVTAPRDTIVIQNQPQASFVFRGRIIYTP